MRRSFDTIQDEVLVLAAQGGDAAAFAALMKRWLPVMHRHAGRLVGEVAAADDVVQEACLAFVGGLMRLNDPAMARAWVLRIVTNKATDWIRRRQRDRKLTQVLKNREPRGAPSDFQSGDEGRAALIRDACRLLSADLRAVVSLYYGEGLSVAEIAAAVSAPAGTVKSRLHEARGQVKSILERIVS